MARATSPRARWHSDVVPYEPVPELPADLVRLAFNESPLGPFPVARAAIAAAVDRAGRYPETDGRLIARLQEHYGLGPGTVGLGNGADAIIGYISAAFLSEGDEVITGWPSFPTYLFDAYKQGATVVKAPLREGAVDLDAVLERIGPRTRLIWVCTPNNPTGGSVTPSAFEAFVAAVPEHVLIAVDEAYHEFAAGPGELDALAGYAGVRPNVAVLRTFSKLYGLAGLRAGYLAAAPEIVSAVTTARHYFDLTGISIAAALASLDDAAEVIRRRELTAHGRERLTAGLASLGYPSLPSLTNFVAAEVGDADAVSARLLAAGVATRSLSGLGEPGLLRITVGTDAEIDLVLDLLGSADA